MRATGNTSSGGGANIRSEAWQHESRYAVFRSKRSFGLRPNSAVRTAAGASRQLPFIGRPAMLGRGEERRSSLTCSTSATRLKCFRLIGTSGGAVPKGLPLLGTAPSPLAEIFD